VITCNGPFPPGELEPLSPGGPSSLPSALPPARHMQPARAVSSCHPWWFSLQKLGRVLGGLVRCHPPRGPGGGMPPEHDDDRARQLEAMRRYFAKLGVQRDGPTVEASEPQPASERRWRPSRRRAGRHGTHYLRPVAADAASDRQAFDGRYDPWWGPRGCVLGATAERLFPRGLGRSRAATPSGILLTRPLGHKPMGALVQRRSSWSSPAKKIRPDRCGAATLTP
jgi:hypothetical protein